MPRCAVLLLLVLVSLGCPGQRRPDPALAGRLRERTPPAPPEPTPAPEETREPAPAERLDALATGLVELEEQQSSYEQAPTRRAWEQLLARIDALQTEAFSLQESEDEALLERLYPLLERIELVRADVVANQPK